METGLEGSVALVAASSRGIGKAIALGLAREGANVAMIARRGEVLRAAAEEVRGAGRGEVLEIAGDVSEPELPSRAVERVVEKFGRLDVLVTNAGGPPPGPFESQDDSAWQRAFDLNLMSAVRLVRAALPHLKASGRGRIITLTSSSVKQPIENLVLSNSIRAGATGLEKTLSTELARFGITVNNIAPGRIDTERIRELDRSSAAEKGITEEEARNSMLAQIPLGRYGTPEEVANVAVFLASDKAAYITGVTIMVDGGMLKSLY